MKKVIILLALVWITLAAPAQAYWISGSNPPGSQIGDQVFYTSKISFTVNEPFQLILETNYPGYYKVGDWETVRGDILLDMSYNGKGWDYALPVQGHDGFVSGTLVKIEGLYYPDDYNNNPNYIHGNDPVRVKTGTVMPSFTGNWHWDTTGGTNPAYIGHYIAGWSWVQKGNNQLTVFTSTATCDNGPISASTNPVPLPPALFLFAPGVAGLLYVRRKVTG